MNSLKNFLLLALAFLVFSCNNQSNKLTTGIWLVHLKLDKNNPDLVLPFNMEVSTSDDGNPIIKIFNAEEVISINEITITDDSVFLFMPVFDSEFRGKFDKNSIKGFWHNYAKATDYKIPFLAQYGISERFESTGEGENVNVSGRWEVAFGDGDDPEIAIGEFLQNGNKVKGTFLTETGDYRFLEGIVRDNQLLLSAFDGSHAFLFTANINEEEELTDGVFYSGNHYKTTWKALKNPDITIGDPESLTFIKEGYNGLDFCFKRESSEELCLKDKNYEDKVVIVQILGSWCPNCMDETALLSKLYKKYHKDGLEVIGLAFERASSHEKIYRNINRLKERYDVGYEIVYAGVANKTEANIVLPMLNQIISYPTTFFIDRNGEIRKIYTGFMGPGTGKHYTKLVNNFEGMLDELLSESKRNVIP